MAKKPRPTPQAGNPPRHRRARPAVLITASSIRPSITARRCSIRPRRIRSRIAPAIIYGRRGTPTCEALENALKELEGPECAGVVAGAVGHEAVATALLSVRQRRRSSAGHRQRLSADAQFCDSILKRLGVETTYYDPLIGERHRNADEAEHARRVRRSARLAKFRDAGHSGDRRGRARQRRAGADG